MPPLSKLPLSPGARAWLPVRLLLGIGADINLADNQNSANQQTQFTGGSTGSVPEPESLALVGVAALGVFASRSRRRM